MNLTYQPFELKFKYPFRIAISSRTSTPLVLTQISHENFVGSGEASMPPYLGENVDTATTFLAKTKNVIAKLSYPFDIQSVMAVIDALGKGNTAAKASVDIALHDLMGKIEAQPVWKILGSNPEKMPLTSCTIGIDTPSVLREKIADTAAFSVLKIKLGSDNDREIIETIRSMTDKPLYVDANQGWHDRAEALDFLHWLNTQGVILVEQPFEKTRLDDSAWLSERSPLPIFADESFQRYADFDTIQSVFHGVNIKLMKCTGLFEAKKMVEEARARKLQILIGCMSETSCGIMAAAALAPQCDFVDLDGPWLTTNNPFLTPILRGGKISLSPALGLGLEPKAGGLN